MTGGVLSSYIGDNRFQIRLTFDSRVVLLDSTTDGLIAGFVLSFFSRASHNPFVLVQNEGTLPAFGDDLGFYNGHDRRHCAQDLILCIDFLVDITFNLDRSFKSLGIGCARAGVVGLLLGVQINTRSGEVFIQLDVFGPSFIENGFQLLDMGISRKLSDPL